MATIGTLAVNLITNIGGFTKPLKTAEGQLGGFAAGLSKLSPIAANAVSSLMPLVGTIALVHTSISQLTASFSRLDELGKLSDQTGIALRDLRGLQIGSQFVGSSVEVMNKSLLIFTRRLGEAAEGSGEGKKALESLGISAKDIANLPVGESLRLIADRIKDLPTPTAKAGIAFSLLGREGLKLVALFNQGATGIDALADEAEDLGGVFDRIDVLKVEAANDAIVRLKTTLGAFADSTAIELGPSVENAVAGATAAVKGVRAVLDVMRTVRDTFYNTLLEWHPAFILAGKGLEAAGIVEGTDEAGENVGDLLKNQEDFNAALEETAKKVEKISELQKFANTLFKETRTPLEEYNAQMDRIYEALDEGLIDWRTWTRATEQAREKLESTFDDPVEVKVDPVLEGIKGEVERLFEQTRTPFERYEADVNRILDLFEGGFLDVDTATRAIGQAQDRLNSLTGGPEGADEKSRDQLVAGPAALRKGSSEAFSAILAAGRQNDKPQQQTAKNTKDTADRMSDVHVAIGDLLKEFNKFQPPKPIQIAGG